MSALVVCCPARPHVIVCLCLVGVAANSISVKNSRTTITYAMEYMFNNKTITLRTALHAWNDVVWRIYDTVCGKGVTRRHQQTLFFQRIPLLRQVVGTMAVPLGKGHLAQYRFECPPYKMSHSKTIGSAPTSGIGCVIAIQSYRIYQKQFTYTGSGRGASVDTGVKGTYSLCSLCVGDST